MHAVEAEAVIPPVLGEDEVCRFLQAASVARVEHVWHCRAVLPVRSVAAVGGVTHVTMVLELPGMESRFEEGVSVQAASHVRVILDTSNCSNSKVAANKEKLFNNMHKKCIYWFQYI